MSSTATSPDMATLLAERTMEKYAQAYFPRLNQVSLSFRGDRAEKYGYDKIRPLGEARNLGNNVVAVEGMSHKTGATNLYRIECNSWNLIEALEVLEELSPPRMG
ncbi:hypothetical protein DZC30_20205 [Comamonas testosteroni]|uniref:Uncharacterized protein n=1 Tax=Comamonas testosteroni TaxID=285 RepID=A0A373FAE2_COMTE|nr:hypothetical protein [Comamonas testosteroni]RGE40472.1 hypothetical protein DZC30_20205 [Comamonas testosteroni]